MHLCLIGLLGIDLFVVMAFWTRSPQHTVPTNFHIDRHNIELKKLSYLSTAMAAMEYIDENIAVMGKKF